MQGSAPGQKDGQELGTGVAIRAVRWQMLADLGRLAARLEWGKQKPSKSGLS